MPAKVTIEDLRWLRNQLPELPDVDGVTVERLQDWLDMCIAARVAQKTKSKTVWHSSLMEAYEAAVIKWQTDCENFAVGYKTEIAEYRERHPMPQLKDFMRTHRAGAPADVCPYCGSPLPTERND